MCLQAGRLERTWEVLDAALQYVDETGEENWYSEIERTLGALTLAENGDRGAAEKLFRQSVARAEQRGAWGYALKAAIDLCEHLVEDGNAAGAMHILEHICAQVDADTDFPDLRATVPAALASGNGK